MRLPALAVATLSVVVASTTSSLASVVYKGPPDQQSATKIQCDKSKQIKPSEITLPNSTLVVSCTSSEKLKPEVTPSSAATLVCEDKDCKKADVPIKSVCTGATMMAGNSNREVTITVPQLPTTTQVFFMQCVDSLGTTAECTAQITVQAAKPQGPQSCAIPGGSITLQIQGEGASAYFGCGTNSSLYPSEATKALSADCDKEETVKELTRTTTEGNYVELKATKNKKKTLCYLCKNPELGKAHGEGAGGDCKVLVHVSGSTPLLSRVVFALTLPFVLTLQHFT